MAETKPIYSDTSLWDAFRSGDKTSFGKLIQAQYASLFSYATRFCKDHEFVKDCLQDLFLDLWKNRASLGSTDYVRSYLFKCVRNKMGRELHRNRHYLQAVTLDDNYCFDVAFSIEHHLIREETLRDVASRFSKALNGLPRRQKEVVYLRFYQNFEIQEIVEVLEINTQSVYNLIHKALTNLRDPLLAEKQV